MQQSILLSGQKFRITLLRLCHQLIENHHDFKNAVIVGIQPRGTLLAKRIKKELQEILGFSDLPYGELDITFFRDDFRRAGTGPLVPNSTSMDFVIENRNVILIDDVLWTGRTVRAAMDAIQSFGRPRKIELLALVDRRFSRHLPIEADYIGIQVDSINSQKVIVNWEETENEDRITLLNGE